MSDAPGRFTLAPSVDEDGLSLPGTPVSQRSRNSPRPTSGDSTIRESADLLRPFRESSTTSLPDDEAESLRDAIARSTDLSKRTAPVAFGTNNDRRLDDSDLFDASQLFPQAEEVPLMGLSDPRAVFGNEYEAVLDEHQPAVRGEVKSSRTPTACGLIWLYTKWPSIPAIFFLLVALGVSFLGLLSPPALDYGINSFRVSNHFSARREDALTVAQRTARSSQTGSSSRRRLLSENDDVTSIGTFEEPLTGDFRSQPFSFSTLNVFDVEHRNESGAEDSYLSVTQGSPFGLTRIPSADAVPLRHLEQRAERQRSHRHHILQNREWVKRSYLRHRVHLAFESFNGDGSDMLTPKRLQIIKSIEDKLKNVTGYRDHCWTQTGPFNTSAEQCRPLTSVLTWLYPSISPRTGKEFNDGNGTELKEPVSLTLQSAMDLTNEISWFMSKEFSATNKKTSYLRATMNFGIPYTGYTAPGDRTKDQSGVFSEWVANDLLPVLRTAGQEDVRLLYNGEEIREAEILDALVHDMKLAIGSLLFIVIYFVVYTGSFFLMIFGILQILLSFPMTWTVYRLGFNFTTLGVMNIISLFVILGIGVDDCFVFIDRWKVLLATHPKATRRELFVHCYLEAGKMTLVTSFTTAAAFAANIVSQIPAIRSFGIFMATLIIANYFLLMTYFPGILMLWDKWFRAKGPIHAAMVAVKRMLRINSDPDAKGATAKFLEGPWARVVTHKYVRHVIWMTFAAVTLFLLFMASQAKSASEPPGLFKGTHNIPRWDRLQKGFTTTKNCDLCSGFDLSKGCDDVFQSNVVLDKCGICKGDGLSCASCLVDSDCQTTDSNATCFRDAQGPGACRCGESYVGGNCEIPTFCSKDIDCRSSDLFAACQVNSTSGAGTCECSGLHHGPRCETEGVCVPPSSLAVAIRLNNTKATSAPSCQNGGVCDSNHLCACTSSFTGSFCGTQKNCTSASDCSDGNVCHGGKCQFCFGSDGCTGTDTKATCNSAGTGCLCSTGFSGLRCETSNVCSSSVDCQTRDANATCQSSGSSTTCSCSTPFTGARCEVSVNCAATSDCNTVDPTAVCNPSVTIVDGEGKEGRGQCACSANYGGLKCTTRTSCETDADCRTLDSTAVCTGGNVTTCACSSGLFSGPLCATQHPCINNGQCSSVDTLATCNLVSNTCTCSNSTRFNGATCQNEHKCQGLGGCLNGGTCVLSNGGLVSTCTCPAGFQGDRCESPSQCTTNGDCVNSFTCVNQVCTCGSTADACGVCGGDGTSCPQTTLRVQGNVGTFNETEFRQRMAASLGISPEDIVIENVSSGSVIVQFRVRDHRPSSGPVVSGQESTSRMADMIHNDDATLQSNQINVISIEQVNHTVIPPDRPVLTLTPASSSGSLTWSAAATGSQAAIVEFELQQRTGLTNGYVVALSGLATSFATGGLPIDTRFAFRLRARNSAGWGPYTSPQFFWTDASFLPGVLPAPTFSSVDSTALTIVSPYPTPAPTGPIDHYETEITNYGNGSYITTVVTNTTHTETTVGNVTTINYLALGLAQSGLGAETTYGVRVRTKNSFGTTGYSPSANVTTLPTAVPDSPTVAYCQPDATSIHVNWTYALTGNQAPKTDVRLVFTPAGPSVTISASNVNETVAGLVANTLYTIDVSVSNARGQSTPFTFQCRTLPTGPPDPPSLVGRNNMRVAYNQINLDPAFHSATELTIEWAAATTGVLSPVLEYEIESTLAASLPGGWSLLTSSSTAGTQKATGLTADTEYAFRARARNAHSWSSWSANVLNTTIAAAVPDAPIATMNANGSLSLTVEWNPAGTGNLSPILLYIIETNPNDGAWAELTRGELSLLSYRHVGLSPGETHQYRVRSVNTAGSSPFSDVVSGTTLAVAAPDPPVISPTVQHTVSSVFVQWSAAPSPPSDPSAILNCSLQISPHAANNSDVTLVSAGNVYSQNVSALTPSTEYFFRVRAANNFGWGDYSAFTSLWTQAASVPDTPSIAVQSGPSNVSVTVEITPPSTGDPSPMLMYSVDVSSDDGLAYANFAVSNSTVHTVTGLSSSTSYLIRANVSNSAGYSAGSTVAVTTQAGHPPLSPVLSRTSGSETHILVTWVPNAGGDQANITMYELEVDNSVALWVITGNITTSYNLTGLSFGQPHRFRIRAGNSVGDGEWSSLVTYYTDAAAVPDAPMNLTLAGVTSDSANVTWRSATTGDLSPILEYALFTSIGGGPFAETTLLSPTEIHHVFSGLASSTSLSFRLSARNSLGWSANSTANGATLAAAVPDAPTLALLNRFDTGLDYGWTFAGSGDLSPYVSVEFEGDSALIATVSPTPAIYNWTSLTPATQYSARVRVSNSLGFSAWSNLVSVFTEAVNVPDAPTSLSPSVVFAGPPSTPTVQVSWVPPITGDVSPIISYQVEIAGAGSGWTAAYTGQLTLIQLDSLQPYTNYAFRVRAENHKGLGAIAGPANATTVAAAPPDPPTITTASVTDTFINITWSRAATGDQSPIVESQVEPVGSPVVSTTEMYAEFSGLSESTEYTFRVRVENSLGYGGFASLTVSTFASSAPGSFSLGAPTTLTNSSALFSFDAPTGGNPEVTDYGVQVYACDYNVSATNTSLYINQTLPGPCHGKSFLSTWSTEYNISHTVNVQSRQIDLQGLIPDTRYSVRARSVNTAGVGNWTFPVNFTTRAARVPDPPSLPTITVLGNNVLQIPVTAASTGNQSPLTGVRIEMKVDTGAYTHLGDATLLSGTQYQYVTGSLAADRVYRFRAQTVNSLGGSVYSNLQEVALRATARPDDPPPPDATLVTSNFAELSFALSPSGDQSVAQEWILEQFNHTITATSFVNATSDSQWKEVYRGSVASFKLSPLSPLTDYAFRIRVRNSYGWSPNFGPHLLVRTKDDQPPSKPVLLCANATANRISLDWTVAWESTDQSDIDKFVLLVNLDKKTEVTEILPTPPAVVFPRNTTSYQRDMTGLSPGARYRFRVAARNSAGYGPASTSCSLNTQATSKPPKPVLAVSPSAIGATQVTVSWSISDPVVAQWSLEVATSGGTSVVTLDGDVRVHTIKDLVPGSTITVRISGTNSAGVSEWSDTVTATTIQVGCDGLVNSGLILDECGVCGGTGKLDIDGNCCNSTARDCEGRCGGGKQLDGNSLCCYPNEVDCAGNCLGGFTLDSNQKCCSNTSIDTCGVCFGRDDCQETLTDKVDTNSVRVFLVWGVRDVARDPDSAAFEDPLVGAEVAYDPNFDLTDPTAQQHIFDTCQKAKRERGLVQQTTDTGAAKCLLLEFKEWRQQRLMPFPVPKSESLYRALEAFFTDRPSYRSSIGYVTGAQSGQRLLQADNGDPRVGFVSASFLTNAKPGSSAAALKIDFDKWEAFMEETNKDAPPTAQSGYQSAEQWSPMFSEMAAIGGLFYGIVIAVVAAFVCILVFTGHFAMTCVCIFTMICIVCAAMGTFSLLGWEFGAVEAIAITVIVGSSVDYSVHLAEGYMEEAGLVASEERVKSTLAAVGTSVLHSSVTTIGSSAMLLFTTIAIFSKFGYIMVINIGWSVIYAMTFFTSFTAAFGPVVIKSNRGGRRAAYLLCVALVTFSLFGLLYILAQEGIVVPGPSGDPLFEPASNQTSTQ